MKKIFYSLMTVAVLALFASCNKTNYNKTKTGMLYKIISDNSGDSVVRPGDWLKIHFQQTRERESDSVLQTTYGKSAIYQQVVIDPTANYNPTEIFHLLKKGDSVVTVLFIDSLISKKIVSDLPPYLKKGDKMMFKLKVVEVFRNDSLYRIDAQKEYEKDRELQMSKVREEKAKQLAELEQSGDGSRQRKVVEDYLAAKKVNAQKTGRGTYVLIQNEGTGPQAVAGKFVTVKYSGRLLSNDSTFESGVYPNLQLGTQSAIDGWDEGLLLFKEGGKGTLYIPGYLAYGKNPRPGSPFKPDEPLIFDVEIVKVSDSPVAPAGQ
jgi:FKBP-type peptidyl-prolyl cis-trans isomerase FkpA